MKAIERHGRYEVEASSIDELVSILNGGDELAIYRPFWDVIDVYGPEVSDEEAEQDKDGFLASEIYDIE